MRGGWGTRRNLLLTSSKHLGATRRLAFDRPPLHEHEHQYLHPTSLWHDPRSFVYLRGWDAVALQEVWHARERDALRQAALAAGLRYSRHFEHGCGVPLLGPGMSGTGLLVLSRYPIAESCFWVSFVVLLQV